LLYYSTPIDESEAPPGLSRAVPRRVSIPSVGDEARTDPGDGVRVISACSHARAQ
jgi:hypothetical protein